MVIYFVYGDKRLVKFRSNYRYKYIPILQNKNSGKQWIGFEKND